MPFFTCFFVSPPFVIFGFLDCGIVVCWREKEEKKQLSQRTSFLSLFLKPFVRQTSTWRFCWIAGKRSPGRGWTERRGIAENLRRMSRAFELQILPESGSGSGRIRGYRGWGRDNALETFMWPWGHAIFHCFVMSSQHLLLSIFSTWQSWSFYYYIYSVLLPAVRILTHFFDHFSALPWFVLWAGGRRAGLVSMEHWIELPEH